MAWLDTIFSSWIGVLVAGREIILLVISPSKSSRSSEPNNRYTFWKLGTVWEESDVRLIPRLVMKTGRAHWLM